MHDAIDATRLIDYFKFCNSGIKLLFFEKISLYSRVSIDYLQNVRTRFVKIELYLHKIYIKSIFCAHF